MFSNHFAHLSICLYYSTNQIQVLVFIIVFPGSITLSLIRHFWKVSAPSKFQSKINRKLFLYRISGCRLAFYVWSISKESRIGHFVGFLFLNIFSKEVSRKLIVEDFIATPKRCKRRVDQLERDSLLYFNAHGECTELDNFIDIR